MTEYSLSETFNEAATYLSSSSALSQVSNTIKLELYGLFKFLTVSRTPNGPRPSLLDFTGKAKWDSWNDIGKKFADKDPAEAEERYIVIAKSLGWQQGSSESKRASEDASRETGAGGISLGVSVSFMKPPEHHGEDIHSLAISGNVEMMKQLFDSDSIPNVDERDEYGYTPLHLSCDRGHTGIVTLLLYHNADPNIKDPDDLTVFELAEIAGHEEIIALLKNRENNNSL